MKVRDELQGGLPFTPTRVRWATEALIPRTASIGWGCAWSASEERKTPDQKAWALDADGEAWWPVEVVAVDATISSY